jgi:hypothetical protein
VSKEESKKSASLKRPIDSKGSKNRRYDDAYDAQFRGKLTKAIYTLDTGYGSIYNDNQNDELGNSKIGDLVLTLL